MKKKLIKILIFILPVLLAAAVPLAAAYSNSGGVFTAYLNFIEDKSPLAIDRLNLENNLIKGALSGTDKYSYFLGPEAYKSHVSEYQDANFVGIGVTITMDQRGAYVISVFTDSPAYRAGIKAGDIIVSADGVDLGGKSLQDIASLIRGPIETEVILGVVAGGSGEPVIFTVVRDIVKIRTVDYTIFKDTAYIRITGFTNKTGEEFEAVLDKIEKAETNNLIIDLRNNGGGTIKGCIDVARKVLSGETIVKLDFKYEGYLDLTYKAAANDRNYNIAVIVNENTASASEILAASIQDNDRGILVGETTFGKSLVQSTYQILDQEAYMKYSELTGESNMYVVIRKTAMMGIQPDDDEWHGAVKLTIGEYKTPDGKSINNTGITPDYIIDYDGPVIFDKSPDDAIWIYDKYDIGMSSEEIKKAKYILGELGYYSGELTGYYDVDTFEAVLEFQADEGLYPYGVLDFTTQQALNNRLKLFNANLDPQFTLAYQELERNGQ